MVPPVTARGPHPAEATALQPTPVSLRDGTGCALGTRRDCRVPSQYTAVLAVELSPEACESSAKTGRWNVKETKLPCHPRLQKREGKVAVRPEQGRRDGGTDDVLLSRPPPGKPASPVKVSLSPTAVTATAWRQEGLRS